ncbi:MAG: hypothetical protein H7Y88_13580 [Phycisphaerales bacterium]|nr:hypothetical protein [Phycisphaerales bacterium]
MAAYELDDLNGSSPFAFRSHLIYLNTDTECVDVVFFVRDDFVLPDPSAGATVQAVTIGGPVGPDAFAPIAFRISGKFASVIDSVEGMFPAGSDGESDDGKWGIEFVDDNGNFSADIYNSGTFIGRW